MINSGRLICFFLVLSLIGVSMACCYGTILEVEPNDDRASAHDVRDQIQGGTNEIFGLLDTDGADFSDVFLIADSAKSPVRVKAFFQALPDLTLNIRDHDGTHGPDSDGIWAKTDVGGVELDVVVPKGSGLIYLTVEPLDTNQIYKIDFSVESADTQKPTIKFLGKPEQGKRITKVKALCKDNVCLDSIRFFSSRGRKSLSNLNIKRLRVVFRFRGRQKREKVKIVAEDTSGKIARERRVYRM